MANISAKQVKDLRDKTGVGMMDVKKALVSSDGDEEKAMEYLREKGIAKAQKKSGNVAENGLAKVAVKNNRAVLVEVNAETDYVATNSDFNDLVDLIADKLVENNPASVDDALALSTDRGTLNDDIVHTTQTTGEKITLRRFKVMEKGDDDHFGSYIHNGGQIGALVLINGADDAVAKNVAMHVAAINPEFVGKDDIPSDRLESERETLKQQALDEGKPENIVKKMVEGRLNKFLAGICLNNQEFVMDSDQTVEDYLSSNNGKVKGFTRYQVGEEA